jgi:hypothetical protein
MLFLISAEEADKSEEEKNQPNETTSTNIVDEMDAIYFR